MFYAATHLLLFSDPTQYFLSTPGNLSIALTTSEPTIYRQFLAGGIDLNQFSLDHLPVLLIEDAQGVVDGDADPLRGAQPITMADTTARVQ